MLVPWRKIYDKPRQHIKKQRHHFANKSPYSQSYHFSRSHVQVWELTIKKAEHWRTDAFELWCWKRFLRVLWTARISNQSILKEINPEYSLEELMLKLQYFGHLMWRADSQESPWCSKRLRAGGEGPTEDETVGWHHQLNGREFEQALEDGEGQGSLACCNPRGRMESDTTEQLKNNNIPI